MNFKRIFTQENREEYILNQVRKKKEIVYGAQSMNKQIIPFLHRSSFDYDIFSPKPRSSARSIEKELDRRSGGNYYYTKPAMHPGTWKVMDVGLDNKKGTTDDYGVVDYTKQPRQVSFTIINGVRYVKTSATVADKRKALRDKQYAFRHEKDREDIRRIQESNKIKRYYK